MRGYTYVLIVTALVLLLLAAVYSAANLITRRSRTAWEITEEVIVLGSFAAAVIWIGVTR